MAAKFFTGLPLDGPDPGCAQVHRQAALRQADPAAAPGPLAGFGSEASKGQHYVLDAAHTQRKG
jgi:hypothetical protein